MTITSTNPEEREEALRRLVRRHLADASASVTSMARELGRPRQLLDKQLAEDGDCYLRLSDLAILERVAPGIAAELLAPIGLRVIPGVGSGQVGDILAAIAKVMSGVGSVTATTTSAIPGGIDGPEAMSIDRDCKRVLEAIGTLQASVAAAASSSRSRR